MTADELKAWAEGEVKALIACGVAPLDARECVERVLAKLPDAVDLATWVPPAPATDIPITDADIADSRADWYADELVKGKFKMLLDATDRPLDA